MACKKEIKYMTTIFKKGITCGFCGKKSEHDVICSTNTFGSPDLDTRPPIHLRYTINTWVQRCPHCGYCASNIEEVSERAESMINSREYYLQLTNDEYPELVNSFLCKAMLEKANEDLPQSIWSTIHATWACDDSGDDELSMKCRIKAVKLIKKAELIGQTISDEPKADIAITVDLLRRAMQFDEALQMIERTHHKIQDAIIRKVLEFQKELILRSDYQCHTVNEALEA
jgi:hypothetical protein